MEGESGVLDKAVRLFLKHPVEAVILLVFFIHAFLYAMQQIIVEEGDAGLFELAFKHLVAILEGIEEAGMQLSCQREALTRITVNQGFLGHGFAGKSIVHQCGIEIGESLFDKQIDHFLDLFDINGRSFVRVCLGQAHQTETKFFHVDQPPNFAVKSAMASLILICCGHTASQLRQPMQAEGFLSSGKALKAIGAMKPPPLKLCSL